MDCNALGLCNRYADDVSGQVGQQTCAGLTDRSCQERTKKGIKGKSHDHGAGITQRKPMVIECGTVPGSEPHSSAFERRAQARDWTKPKYPQLPPFTTCSAFVLVGVVAGAFVVATAGTALVLGAAGRTGSSV